MVDLEDSGDVKKRKVAVSYTLKYDSAMQKSNFGGFFFLRSYF